MPARRQIRFVVLALAAGLVSGCGLPYYAQAIHGQVKLLRARTPIEAVLEDPDADPGLQSKLRNIVVARRFAVERLALPDNDSYTSYVDIGRDYVVWNVIAAEEFSVDPVTWCFPVAGCVAYRGYFDRDDAEKFQAKLDARGYDTYSGGSSAYSTLGHFDDPVLSTMLDGGDEYSAGVLFHELAHQQLYFKGDSELSEAFATAVEESGMELWLSEHGGPEALEAYRARLGRRADFAALIGRQQQRLSEVYAGGDGEAEMRAAKDAAFDAMRADYRALKQQWGGLGDYDRWFDQRLNNASLAAVATYRRWVPALRWRLGQLGFAAFYDEMERLAKLDDDARERRLSAWAEHRSMPGMPPES
jgi:predicted aminopeptidase